MKKEADHSRLKIMRPFEELMLLTKMGNIFQERRNSILLPISVCLNYLISREFLIIRNLSKIKHKRNQTIRDLI